MKHIRLIQVSFFIIIISFLSACSGPTVSEDHDLEYKPDRLGTYLWERSEKLYAPVEKHEPLFHKRVVKNINSYMTEQNVIFDNNPDFYVTYSYSVKSKIKSSPAPTLGFGLGSWGRYGGIGIGTSTREYSQKEYGYLFIDFIDARTGKLFWRGKGQKQLKNNPGHDELDLFVKELVISILEKSPIQPSVD